MRGGRRIAATYWGLDVSVIEQIAVMVVTSLIGPNSHMRNLSGFNRTKLKQDGGNPARLIQDLLQAYVTHISKIDDQQHVPHVQHHDVTVWLRLWHNTAPSL